MKIFISILLIIFIFAFTACTDSNSLQDTNQQNIENAESESDTSAASDTATEGTTDQTVTQDSHNTVLSASKFADYFTAIISAQTPDKAVYHLEKTITVDDVTTSIINVVKNGTVLIITETKGEKSVSIFSHDTLTAVNTTDKTYTRSPLDEESYNNVLSTLECTEKYKDIEFVASQYTVVDKEHYAEVAVINDTPRIFIFDDNYALKYIVYTNEEGSLVTEEIFKFTSEVDDEIFVIPDEYTEL